MPDWLNWTLLGSVLSIVVIDLVLSGDNALVIGMASRRLPGAQRRWAIILGGTGAIGLRALCTAAAVFLLAVPLLQAAGGLLLTWIAYKLLREESESKQEAEVEPRDSLRATVQTILLADVVMSIDNILAVGGAAHGSLWLLLFGLALSMPLILFGSGLIARLMNRLPWLGVAGAVVLTITAARMIVHDHLIDRLLGDVFDTPAHVLLTIVLTLIALLPILVKRIRRDRLPLELPR